MNYYYLYLIKFEDGQFYIGSRQSKVLPEYDTNYWGSPVSFKHLWEDVSLTKTKHILKVCDSFEEMRDMESEFIKDAWKKFPQLCLNRNATPIFHPDICKNALSKEQRIEIGKKCKELGLGIHGISKDERVRISKKAGQKIKNLGIGVCGLSRERKIEIGKKCKELGLGIHGLSKDERDMMYRDIAEKKSKHFKLKSPNGDIITGKNIAKFCRENNLTPQCIGKVILGKEKSHKGWTKP